MPPLPETPPETFGQMAEAARKRLKMSQRELAEAVKRRGGELSQGYVSLYERTAGTPKEPEVGFELVGHISSVLRLDRQAALLAAGKNPNAPKHKEAELDTIRVRILLEFDVVGADGERRPIQADDLTPGMRRELAKMLVDGDLDKAVAAN